MLIENNIAKIFSIRYDINIFRLKNNFRNGGIVIMNNNNEKNNIKMTKNRKIILETIDRYNAPITAEELFFVIKQSTSMSLSTVYRILGFLSDNGILLKNTGMDGKSCYQRNCVP